MTGDVSHGGQGTGRLAALLLLGLSGHIVTGQTSQPTPEAKAEASAKLRNLAGLVTGLLTGQPSAPQTGTVEEAAGPTAPPEPGRVTRAESEPNVATGGPTLLDLHVRYMEIATLLEMLSYQAHANIVTSTSVTGQVSANLYSVTLEEALEAILTPNQYAFHVSGNTVFVGTPTEIAALGPPPVTRVFRLRYIGTAEAAAAIKAVLGTDASVVEGGGGSTTGSGGSAKEQEMGPAGVDYLVVTDQPQRLAAAEQLLAEIDWRPKQVLIEATVLRATLNEANQFGIDFTTLGGVGFQNVGSTSNASVDLQTGPLPPDQFQDTTFNVNTDFSGSVTGGGFSFGLVKNNIAVFIRALEEITDVVVVANPKVVALNKQEAEVIVGRRDGYLTTTVTETAAIQTVEFLETGTQIKFRPLINEDGTVRLLVHPKDSNGGLTVANLPFEETTEAHADLLVDDGNTILIGGLFRERTVNSKTQIPLLGEIPLAGLLFGSRNDQTIREEVIILLTVHIIKQTEQERDQHEQLLEDVERIRVGSRMGLLGTGRERLAQAYFHEALSKLEQGDLQRALLNVRMTLNSLPKHLPAIKLRERLWDDEGTRMRTFIRELILKERAADPTSRTPLFGRPGSDLDLPSAAGGAPNP